MWVNEMGFGCFVEHFKGRYKWLGYFGESAQ